MPNKEKTHQDSNHIMFVQKSVQYVTSPHQNPRDDETLSLSFAGKCN